ncbi:MAG: cupin domain-containing protein [Actinomycetota bacterium]
MFDSLYEKIAVGVTVLPVVSALALAGPEAPAAHATPPVGTTSTVLSKHTVDGRDYIVSEIIIAPNGSTGWHTHRGEVYGIVKAGVLTHYGADCREDGRYATGMALTDPAGAEHAHLGRNLGPVPVVLEVTYVDPEGAQPSDSVPSPGCDVA